MSWIENNPYKMAIIVSILCSLGATIIHLKDYTPPEWDAFFMWLPSVWLFCFSPVLFFDCLERIKLKVNKT